ncbi:MAG: hypothetical protein KDE47_05230, partial [Caldilineaceae bacterium]|nr:hypothetical protein [Caldilineaceae bacterium]
MRKHISLFSTLALMLALLLSACAAPAAAPADSGSGDSAAAPTEAPAEAAASSDDVFTYWGGLIFSDAANQMLVDRVTQWGEERGVKTEVVMINQNETVQRVSAAI